MRRMYQKYVLLFNMNYTIRKSLIEDLPDILCLRDEAREYMRKNGNLHQWPVGYPPEDTFISDIESGNSYIVENSNGIPVGTFAFLPCSEPTYQTIYKGKWLAEDHGCTYCGIIYLKNGDERLAYQKVINNGQQVHL